MIYREGIGPSSELRPVREKAKKKSKKPSPASVLTDQVIKYVKICGGTARRVNTTGIYDESIGKWRTSMTRRGYEDVDVTMMVCLKGKNYGFKIGVEIKIGKDVQSEYQKKRQEELEAAGGEYWIIKDLETFKQNYFKYLLRLTTLLG